MSVDELRAQMEAVAAAEAASLADAPASEPDPEFVRECLAMEERGDGTMFAELHRGKFVMVKNWGKSGVWLRWAGHHWERDEFDLAHDAVENVAMAYQGYVRDLDGRVAADREEEARAASDEEKHRLLSRLKKLHNERRRVVARIGSLRRMRGATNCLSWAHRIGKPQSLSVSGDALDTHPWLLACPNGVLDLRTGEFGPGRPDDYLLRTIAVPWEGIDAPCPTWDAFIEEIHQGDREIIAYLDRLFGYCLTGLSTEHFLGFFLGEGRNGKGTMFEVLRDLMGDMGWSINSELIMEQKNGRSSAGPSPDLIALHGKRLVVASESNDNRRISLDMVKLLTGDDTISARAPFDTADTNFKPTWKLFFYTNNIPPNIAKDFAMQQRLVFIDYPLKYVEDPDPNDPMQRKRNPNLKRELLKELPGILARCVRGCLEWQKGGMRTPRKIRLKVDDLAQKQDDLLAFFNECCVFDPDAHERFGDLYAAFEEWWKEEVGGQERLRPTRKSMSARLVKRGCRRGKPGGVATVYGIRVKTTIEQDMP